MQWPREEKRWPELDQESREGAGERLSVETRQNHGESVDPERTSERERERRELES
jgi:hypothetical protein